MVSFKVQHFAFTIATVSILFSGFSNATNIRDALQNYPNLSSFLELLNQHKDFENLINTVNQKTILVPTNSALVLSVLNSLSFTDQQALLQYHILNGTQQTSSFAAPGGATMQTFLQGNQFANLGGGQPNVVFTSKFGDSGGGNETQSAQVFSGLGTKSAIEPLNITFNGGIVHAVDTMLSLPETCTSTAKKVNLNGLITALRRTNLTDYVDTTPRITCFAPSDAAFNNSGSPDQKLSPDLLAQALKYHTLQGDYIGYTSTWKDGQELTTLAGDSVVVKHADGVWWVNDVKVLQANVMTSNGVAHVLDGVLSPLKKPTNTTSPTATTSNPSTTETKKSDAIVCKATTTLILALSLPVFYLLSGDSLNWRS
ncbi:FAS1 domain-containing protein [Terfezia claveryi]|nr:FAS1 domain-containing protein [Terfezia claveryi]